MSNLIYFSVGDIVQSYYSIYKVKELIDGRKFRIVKTNGTEVISELDNFKKVDISDQDFLKLPKDTDDYPDWSMNRFSIGDIVRSRNDMVFKIKAINENYKESGKTYFTLVDPKNNEEFRRAYTLKYHFKKLSVKIEDFEKLPKDVMNFSQFFSFNPINKVENLDNEIWYDIAGYEEIYQVSSMGRIKSFHLKSFQLEVNLNEHILSQYWDYDNDPTVKLYIEGNCTTHSTIKLLTILYR